MPAPPGGFHVTGHDPQLYRRPGFYNIVMHPCQTFGVAATTMFFKTTRFNLFACQVVRDPQERGGAAAAARQVDLLAADRTSQHRVDVKYVEVMEAGCFRKVSLPLTIHAANADDSLLPCAAPVQEGAVATPMHHLLQTHIDAEPWRIERGTPSRSGVISNLLYMVQ